LQAAGASFRILEPTIKKSLPSVYLENKHSETENSEKITSTTKNSENILQRKQKCLFSKTAKQNTENKMLSNKKVRIEQ